jgi:hypothetical protein
MAVHTHTINASKRWFLNLHKVDEFTKEPFKTGDRIVVCENCNNVHLEDSWNALGHCIQCKGTSEKSVFLQEDFVKKRIKIDTLHNVAMPQRPSSTSIRMSGSHTPLPTQNTSLPPQPPQCQGHTLRNVLIAAAIIIAIIIIWPKGSSASKTPVAPQQSGAAAKPTVTSAPLTAPGNVRSGNINSDRITIQWNSVGPDLSYKIYYGTQNNAANARTTTATGTSVVVTDLTSNTTYYFWVTATKDKEESAKSPVLAVRTSAATSPPPVNTLNGTTWEYINQVDNNGYRYRLSFSGSNSVTFAIYNRDGSKQEESYNGTYRLQGTNLTLEIVYPDKKRTNYYTYSQSGITDKHEQSIIYRKR